MEFDLVSYIVHTYAPVLLLISLFLTQSITLVEIDQLIYLKVRYTASYDDRISELYV